MSSALAIDLEDQKPAKPFLKWAGGKTQLIPEILARVPARIGRYYEPFIGGGATFFALCPQKATLSDVNVDLIGAYVAVRDKPAQLIKCLKEHYCDEAYYYEVRDQDPNSLSPVRAAARIIFMNRTCFNGLYRVNKKGLFNVPFGKYQNPKICDADNIMRVSEVLQGVDIRVQSVFDSVKRARKGDFVYLDPPYDPVSRTSSFTAYSNSPFGRPQQRQLAELFAKLAKRGVSVLLSNSDTPFIRELYRGFRVERVGARRAINSRSDKRGRVYEVMVTSAS